MKRFMLATHLVLLVSVTACDMAKDLARTPVWEASREDMCVEHADTEAKIENAFASIESLRNGRGFSTQEGCRSSMNSLDNVIDLVRWSDEQRESYLQTRPQELTPRQAKIHAADLDDSGLAALRDRFAACAEEPIRVADFHRMLNEAADRREAALGDVRAQLDLCRQIDGIQWRQTRAIQTRDERRARGCDMGTGCPVGEFCSAEQECVAPPSIQKPRQRGLYEPLELARALNLDHAGFYFAGIDWGKTEAEWLETLGTPSPYDPQDWTLRYDATLMGSPVEIRSRFGAWVPEAPDGEAPPEMRRTHTIHIRTTGTVEDPKKWTVALRSRMGAPGMFWKKEHASMEAWNVIGVGQISLFFVRPDVGPAVIHLKLTREYDKPGYNGFGPNAESYDRKPKQANDFSGFLPVKVGPTGGPRGVKVLENDEGLEVGDVVVEVDGVEIHSEATVDEALRGHEVGDRVPVVLIRDGLRRERDVKLHGHLTAGDSIQIPPIAD